MPVHGDVVAGDRGGPDMAPEHWRERSVIYNLDKVKTPLMLQWGDRDGVRISMADDYYRAAKDRDVEAMIAVNNQLYQSCVSCHQHYRSGYGGR